MPAVVARRNETHSLDSLAGGYNRVQQPWPHDPCPSQLCRLSGKLSGRRDRAVADVVDVALPVFGKLPVGKLEQALITAGLSFRIVAGLDLSERFHHPHVDIEKLCCLLDLGSYVVGVRPAGSADLVWQRHRRPMRDTFSV